MALLFLEHKLTEWLRKANPFWFSVYAAGSAFCLYTCVYAFRKTFAVATFEGLYYGGVSYKVWLVIFQVLGYGMSKFIGIKIISELQNNMRTKGILIMVGIAGISWLFFALIPPPYNIIFLFTNGLPLGMVWGMIFSYLEGRKTTELLGSGLAISFIFSAGLCKSVGGIIMRDWGTSEVWMPFVTGCLFTLPLVLFLWLLDKMPPPNSEDIALRTKREPMNTIERKKFLRTFWPGILLCVSSYVLLTAYRDFRDNFSPEIWETLGYGNSPEIFTATEVPISLSVLAVMACLMMIRNNKLAFMINHIIIAIGMILIGTSTLLFTQRMITAPVWMILVGVGLYLGYVPFNSIFFDRLIATFKYVSTVGFIMYVADAFGYLGSIAVLILKEFGLSQLSWLNFFISGGYALSITGIIMIIGSMIYFHLRHGGWITKHQTAGTDTPDQKNVQAITV